MFAAEEIEGLGGMLCDGYGGVEYTPGGGVRDENDPPLGENP